MPFLSTFEAPSREYLNSLEDVKEVLITDARDYSQHWLCSTGCIEIYGESGSGKTQVCIHLAAERLSASSGNILYICTQSVFPSSRLRDFIQGMGLAESEMNRVFVEHMGDGEALELFLVKLSENWAKASGIVMIIVDSIAACLRNEYSGNQKKWMLIQRLGICLRRLQAEKIDCIVANEVFDSNWRQQPGDLQDLQPIYDMVSRESTLKLSCLGLSSSSIFDTKIWLRKTQDQRQLILLRSPDRPVLVKPFTIESDRIAFRE